MFILGLLLGIYAYILFTLGMFGILYKEGVVVITLLFMLSGVIWQWKKLFGFSDIKNFKKIPEVVKKQKFFVLFFLLLSAQVVINVIGALGPELAFDALWYHLTIPKLWLLNHSIDFIPGGLLYYSVMPKLGELLFVPGLVFGNEILVKIIHFSFGLLTCLALYKLQRKFFSPFVSLLGVIIFYSNLVVAWESVTAYVDLIRTFFEVLALWGFINWWEKKEKKWFVLSASMLSLAITTKLLAIGSLVIFILLLLWIIGQEKLAFKKLVNKLFIHIVLYSAIALFIPLPWFIFAYIHTGNPVYPFFSDIYTVTPEPTSLTNFFVEVWNIFTNSPDPISPVYLIFLPLVIVLFSSFRKEVKLISLYSVLSIIVWYFTPRTGGGRFMMSYLPAFSLVCAGVYSEILKKTRKEYQYLRIFLLCIILLVGIVTLGYRAAANAKYLPVMLGQQSKQEFLTDHLNFSFGDFYDTDNYFKNHITESDRVLLYGFHNLYYVDFPFIDSSWVKSGDGFNYIATQNTPLPNNYKTWKLIYENERTMVKLYKK